MPLRADTTGNLTPTETMKLTKVTT